MTGNTASEKQINFINSLKTQRDITTVDANRALSLSRHLWKIGKFDTRAASALIDVLKAQPQVEAKTEPVEVPEGMHRVNGSIFKVQRAVHGSGRLYAKRLTRNEECYCSEKQGTLCDTCGHPENATWTFEHAPGAIRHLSTETKMTLEEAKQFGALYGTCCVCGRTLTDEKSIAAGIGPVCAGRF